MSAPLLAFGLLMARGKFFVTGQAAIALGEPDADAIDGFADGPREAMDDLLRREFLQVGDDLGPQKLKYLSGFVILVKEHEELFFRCDRGPAEGDFLGAFLRRLFAARLSRRLGSLRALRLPGHGAALGRFYRV